MFKLQDGREQLYQWDLDRYVVVEDKNICEVHFCNRTSDCSLVVEVKDGLAAIPNILLQDARPIRVYAYCDDKYTLTEEQFSVKSRTKPEDYVYTETEVLNYSTLLNRVNDIEENIGTYVEEYLDENDITVDLSNYYNKQETDTLISDKSDKDHYHSQYITQNDLNTWETGFIADIESEYYNKDETNAAIYNSKDSYYLDFRSALNGEENAKPATDEMIAFATRWANKETNICVHIKESDWGITGWQPTIITGLPTNITFRSAAIDTKSINNKTEVNYRNYVLKRVNDEWVYYYTDSYTFTIATKEYVDEAIGNGGSGTTVDLSNYYTKDETYSKQEIEDGYDELENKIPTDTHIKSLINTEIAKIATAEGGSY